LAWLILGDGVRGVGVAELFSYESGKQALPDLGRACDVSVKHQRELFSAIGGT